MEFHAVKNEDTAMNFCYALKDLGLLAKPTHETTIRLSPPLVINEKQVDEALSRIEKGLKKI